MAVKGAEISAFGQHLREEEREVATVEKYLCDVRLFTAWAGEQELDRGLAAAWKEHLRARGYKPETINKGKIRTIFIPGKLCRKLEEHARQLERLCLAFWC